MTGRFVQHASSPPRPDRLSFFVCALAMVAAAVLQLGIAARSPIIAPDGIVFIRMAHGLERDPVSTCRAYLQHPGYPAAVLLVAHFLGDDAGTDDIGRWIRSGRIVSGLCGVACVFFLWLLARRTTTLYTANVAAVAFTVLPLFRQNAADVLSDTPHLLLFLIGCWAAVEGIKSVRIGWWTLSAAASGLAYWIRPEGLAVALVAAASLLVLLTRECARRRHSLGFHLPFPSWTRERGVRTPPNSRLLSQLPQRDDADTRLQGCAKAAVRPYQLVACLIAVGLCSLLAIGPYVALTGGITGKKKLFTHQSGGTTHLAPVRASDRKTPNRLGIGSHGSAAESKDQALWWRFGGKFIAGTGAGVVAFVDEFLDGLHYILLVPCLVGNFVLRRRGRLATGYVFLDRVAGLLILVLIGQYALDVARDAPGYISGRHMMPLIAITMPCIALGGIALAEWLHGLVNLRGPRIWAVAVLLALYFSVTLPWTLRPLHRTSMWITKTRDWLAAHVDGGQAVLTNSDYVSFYSPVNCRLVRGNWLGLATKVDKQPTQRSRQPEHDYIVAETENESRRQACLTSLRSRYRVARQFGMGSKRSTRRVLVFVRRDHSPATRRPRHAHHLGHERANVFGPRVR